MIEHYFVDEAGDLTLFDRTGRVIVGDEGVSRYFMVGLADIEDPVGVKAKLDELRANLLADPYFRGIPSMQPAARKTAIAFHAKDDVPEVRREVFGLLRTLDVRCIAAIRRKDRLGAEAATIYAVTGKKLTADAVYDRLVEIICRDKLHKAEANEITFARRGKSDRNEALAQAIARARASFEKKWGRPVATPTTIRSAYPSESAGLQVVDYFLWALQRMYERREDRFFQLLAPQFRLVMDLDDNRRHGYGEWYSDSNPLSLEKIEPVTPG